jgi:hypothetical protein
MSQEAAINNKDDPIMVDDEAAEHAEEEQSSTPSQKRKSRSKVGGKKSSTKKAKSAQPVRMIQLAEEYFPESINGVRLFLSGCMTIFNRLFGDVCRSAGKEQINIIS